MIQDGQRIRPTFQIEQIRRRSHSREYQYSIMRLATNSRFPLDAGGNSPVSPYGEEAVDLVCKKMEITRHATTHLKPLPGSEEEVQPEELAQKHQIPLFAAARLVYRYGCRARDVLSLSQTHPSHRNILCSCEPVLEAELRYAVRREWARTLEDLSRRTRFGLGPCQGGNCLMLGAQILGEELGISPKQVLGQAREFLERNWREKAPILTGSQLQQEELNRMIHLNLCGLGRS
jgi:glycerol-3-phosphate dehydrogenase